MKGRAKGERRNEKGGNARGGGNRQQERKTAEDLMKRALASQEAGRWDEAVGIYEEALSVCPEHLDCMYNLAVCLIERAEVSCAPRRASRERQRVGPPIRITVSRCLMCIGCCSCGHSSPLAILPLVLQTLRGLDLATPDLLPHHGA